jgi:hypothetical protein
VVAVDTYGGTQRQHPQAHGYQSSFHLEVFQVSYPQGNMCRLNSSLSRGSNQGLRYE